jgi:hypothetical protein
MWPLSYRVCLSDRRFSCRNDTPKRPFKISQTNNGSNLSAYFKSKVGAMGLRDQYKFDMTSLTSTLTSA